MTNLTNMEKEFLNGMRTNDFSDIYAESIDSDDLESDWLFGVVQQCSYTEKQATGVISSLVQKGIIITYDNDGEQCVGFTEEGMKVFDNADGNYPSWDKAHEYKPLFKLEA